MTQKNFKFFIYNFSSINFIHLKTKLRFLRSIKLKEIRFFNNVKNPNTNEFLNLIMKRRKK